MGPANYKPSVFLFWLGFVMAVSSRMLVAQDDATLDAWIFGEDIEEKARRWERDVTVRIGGGVKDNVLLSSVNRVSSPFLLSALEWLSWRLPTDHGWDAYLYTWIENRYYTDAEGIDTETFAIFQTQLSKKLGSRWKIGGLFNYFFADQVYDISVSDVELSTTVLKQNHFELRPFITFNTSTEYELTLQGAFTRELYQESSDNFSEYGYSVKLLRRMGRDSEIWLSYDFEEKNYDQRTRRNSLGFSIANSFLSLVEHDMRVGISVNMGESHHLQSRTLGGLKLISDNGAGYNDYSRYQIAQQFTFSRNRWVLRGELRGSWYDYPVQTVGSIGSALRERVEIISETTLECKLSDSWILFFAYRHEDNRSNRNTDAYSVSTGTFGFDWKF